jgi:hypothetical protein
MFAFVTWFAKTEFSVNLLWVLVILAVIALLIFIFRR